MNEIQECCGCGDISLLSKTLDVLFVNVTQLSSVGKNAREKVQWKTIYNNNNSSEFKFKIDRQFYED